VAEHVQPLVGILPRECDASTFEGFSVAVTGPRPPEFFAPGTQRSSVNDWRRLFQPMRPSHVHHVAIAVPHQLHSRERMVPTEVHATDAWPVRREVSLVDGELRLLDRKDSTRTENWYPLGSGFQFVLRVAGDDGLLFMV